MVSTLAQFLHGIRTGDAIRHGNLVLVPLLGPAQGLDYQPAVEAIETGGLTVSEVSEGGSVPELLAVIEIDQKVLLMDGEELVGAKQNRTLNTSILLPPRSKTRIPVSCVEAGRWRYASRGFSGGTRLSSKLRRLMSGSSSGSYRSSGVAGSDQGMVWNEVDRYLSSTGSSSASGAMHDAFVQQEELLNEYVESAKVPPEARGVAVAVCGRFIALDLLGRPDVFNRLWTRLVSGYAMDAIDSEETAKPAGSFDAHEADRLLARLGEIECDTFASVGVGEDWRFETPDILGHALVAEGTCVHLSAFPGADSGQGEGPA